MMVRREAELYRNTDIPMASSSAYLQQHDVEKKLSAAVAQVRTHTAERSRRRTCLTMRIRCTSGPHDAASGSHCGHCRDPAQLLQRGVSIRSNRW